MPDAKTIWLYREQLKQAGAIEGLFRRFDAALAKQGFLAMGGQIIDATLIAAPRQKLTIEEKATIREGGTPADWSPAKRAQKDRNARWTLKRGTDGVDAPSAPPLDKGYDSDPIRQDLRDRGTVPEIPTKRNRRAQHCVSRPLYALRSRIECFINRLKNNRRVPTRYDQTADSFFGLAALSSIRLWIRFVHVT